MIKRIVWATGASAIALVAPGAGAQSAPKVSAGPSVARPAAADATDQQLRPLYRNVRPFYRNVRAFWGDVNPFYRNVRAFWGDVDPFYRNVRAFWGDLDPVTQAAGVGAPAYEKIGPFWNAEGRRWESIASRWQTAGAYSRDTRDVYASIAADLNVLFQRSRKVWGGAIEQQTGRSFNQEVYLPLLKRFNISPSRPASLARLDAATQSQFFMELYDTLMAYSGTDHADWWMKAVNWTPSLTQTMGSGRESTLGLVDDYASKSPYIETKVKDLTKKSGSTGGHGEGVLSLIVSPHDGKGVMGIAPSANVIAYNPFTAGSASWSDVSDGIQAVAKKGATVINLSLGAPGMTLSPEWQKIFVKSEINTHKDKTLYIIAAGNDGATQTGIVDMKGALDTTFLVVGSVGPSGISEFSNRPGNTCLTDGGTECKKSTSLKESGYLMSRFIVAPGELILVSDGAGGVVRQSGTSLAAPLVAGAVALIQDRWPWMREKPRDIAMVILGSAQDLGEPGIDPVYGVGMLDVEGAMSPLDFNKLKYYLTSNNGKSQNEVSASTLRGQGLQASWSANDMYFTAFEKLDQVERDFLIPLSTRLYGQTRHGEYFQDFVYNRMLSWIDGTNFAGRPLGFSDAMQSAPTNVGGWTMRISGRMVSPHDAQGQAYRPQLRSTVYLTAPSGKLGFSMGHGDGAVALGGGRGFSMAADFDPYSGGTNPLLGFASGGSHAAAQVAIGGGIDVRAGYTEQRQYQSDDLIVLRDANGYNMLGRYRARAMSVELGYDAMPWLRVSAAATNLREPNAVFGVRPLVGSDLAGGSRTNSITVGADADLGGGVALFGTATTARSYSARADTSLRIGSDGISGTSFQAGIAKQGLLGRNDAVRLTVAQPLRLSGGSLELTEVQVIDRETGEKGVVTQRFSLVDTQPRRLVLEGNYGANILDGRAQISLFGRGEMRDLDAGTPRLMLGSQVQLAF